MLYLSKKKKRNLNAIKPIQESGQANLYALLVLTHAYYISATVPTYTSICHKLFWINHSQVQCIEVRCFSPVYKQVYIAAA